MKCIGIDIGMNKHFFSIVNKKDGEILVKPSSFTNNKEGFNFLINTLDHYPKDNILIGMEDTVHYHLVLLKYLLNKEYTVALINPNTTNLTRKLQKGGITNNEQLDTLTICDVHDASPLKKYHHITSVNSFELYKKKQLTRHLII